MNRPRRTSRTYSNRVRSFSGRQLSEAADVARQAGDIAERRRPVDAILLADALHALGLSCFYRAKPADAENALARVVELRESTAGRNDGELAPGAQGPSQLALEKYRHVEPPLQRSLELRPKAEAVTTTPTSSTRSTISGGSTSPSGTTSRHASTSKRACSSTNAGGAVAREWARQPVGRAVTQQCRPRLSTARGSRRPPRTSNGPCPFAKPGRLRLVPDVGRRIYQEGTAA